jgi:hypothetical protein
MLALAWNGITSFSVKPLKAITSLGFFITFLSVLAFIAFSVLFGIKVLDFTLVAYAIMSIWLATGLILIGMGVLGEYIGKIHQEVKARPRYGIAEILNDEK